MTKVKIMTKTLKKPQVVKLLAVKKTKRTLTLSEETDCKLRIFAANQRISIGSLVELMIKKYFDTYALDVSEK